MTHLKQPTLATFHNVEKKTVPRLPPAWLTVANGRVQYGAPGRLNSATYLHLTKLEPNAAMENVLGH